MWLSGGFLLDCKMQARLQDSKRALTYVMFFFLLGTTFLEKPLDFAESELQAKAGPRISKNLEGFRQNTQSKENVKIFGRTNYTFEALLDIIVTQNTTRTESPNPESSTF